MNPMMCDCCGKAVKAVYPCKFVYHDRLICNFDICLDCMEGGTLKINLDRKRKVAQTILKLASQNKIK